MPASEGLLSSRYRRVSVAIYTTIALVAFEGTSVAAALPELTADLGRIDLLPWVITGYLFASGLATIVSGPLVDALGCRATFVWSAAAFTATGFAAGLVDDLVLLIAIRLVQGGASGMVIASAIAAVNLAYPSSLTGRAFAANSTIWGLMGAAAPALAALLLRVASWRWIFFVNLPLGALALLAGGRTLPGPQEGAETPHVDWRGSLLAGVFTLATIAAVDRLGPLSVLYGVLAVLAASAYAVHARSTERPVIRLDQIARQPYLSLGLIPALMVAAAFASNLYITIFVSAGRGFDTSTAAWSVLFFTIGWTTGANASSVALDRLSEIDVITIGLAAGTVGAGLNALAAVADASLIGVFIGLGGMGIGVGLTTNAGLTLLRHSTESRLIGRAGAAHQFMRNQGFTLGSAGGGAILLLVVGRRIGSTDPVQQLLAGEDISVSGEIADAVSAGYATVAVVSSVVMIGAVWPLWTLRRYLATSRAHIEITSRSRS